jgi:hypothetical protein
MSVKDKNESNSDRKMRFFLVAFQRLKTGSHISFVAATDIRKPKEGLRAIFRNKFPGWTFMMAEMPEREFRVQLQIAFEVSRTNWDYRHPNEFFENIENIRGNFFDPDWF